MIIPKLDSVVPTTQIGPIRSLFSRPDTNISAFSDISVCQLMAQSKAIPARELPADVQQMIGRARGLGVAQVCIHDDMFSNELSRRLGVRACCYGKHIYLGTSINSLNHEALLQVLKHEFVHIVQVQRGLATGRYAYTSVLEREADTLDILRDPYFEVRYGAAADRFYHLWWFIPLAVAAYLTLKPNVANAPGPKDKTYTLSTTEVAGELFALIVVPAGAYSIAGRLGWGFYSASALAGASSTMSLRGVSDLERGQFSGVQVYVFDGITGAAVGVIVPGGIRWFGKAGTQTLDWLATQGMRRSDIALGKIMQSRIASTGPMSAEVLEKMLQSRNLMGQASEWWLNRRGQILLYRGQQQLTQTILSPLARDEGLLASESLVARMKGLGIKDSEIAQYTAQWYTQRVPKSFTLPELANEPLGAVGIPTTRLTGIAAGFEDSAVVYIIRAPKGVAIKVPQWGLAVENEWVILNRIPQEYIVDIIPASKLPALGVDSYGRLVLPSVE
jgi:hypothetical protein